MSTILLIIFLPKNKAIKYKPIIPNEYETSLLIVEEDNKYEINSIRKITRTGYDPYTQEYLSALYNNVTTSYTYIEETNKWYIVASLECKGRFDSKATYVSNLTFNNKDLINKTDRKLEHRVNDTLYVISNDRYHVYLYVVKTT